MLIVDKATWRYRAYAATFPPDKIPTETTLCAMFWTTVLFWGMFAPVAIAISVPVVIVFGPFVWVWQRLPSTVQRGLRVLGCTSLGAVVFWLGMTFGWRLVLRVALVLAVLAALLGVVIGAGIAISWFASTFLHPIAMWVSPKIGQKFDDTIGRETLRAWKEKVCPLIRFGESQPLRP